MHTIWLREHNRLVRELGSLNPHWKDERILQEARRIVGALIQKITCVDYLPKVLRPEVFNLVIGPYSGYNTQVNAGTANAFATAAYRYGHSLIRPQFDQLDANYRPLAIGPLNLVNAFFNPTQFRISLGTDPILHGLERELKKSGRVLEHCSHHTAFPDKHLPWHGPGFSELPARSRPWATTLPSLEELLQAYI